MSFSQNKNKREDMVVALVGQCVNKPIRPRVGEC
jgi:hypothetical protein